jgi:hypothetical protein
VSFPCSELFGLVTNLLRLAEHANGEVKAVKLVYKVADTDGADSQGEAAIKWKDLGSKW